MLKILLVIGGIGLLSGCANNGEEHVTLFDDNEQPTSCVVENVNEIMTTTPVSKTAAAPHRMNDQSPSVKCRMQIRWD